jgi:hypothetical protein
MRLELKEVAYLSHRQGLKNMSFARGPQIFSETLQNVKIA